MTGFQMILGLAALAAFGVFMGWPAVKAMFAKVKWPTSQTTGTITPTGDTKAVITVEQAMAAELLLQRFKAQDNSKDPGAALAIAGIKTLAAEKS